MRLALIGPSAPIRGGIARHHDRLAASLAARGHEVERYSFRRLYPRIFFPGRSQLEPESAGGDAGDAAPAAPLLDSLSPASWLRVARAAARTDAALFEWWHPFFAPMLATVATILRRGEVPVVCVCHNLEPHEPVPGGALLSRLALGRATGFVAQSSAAAARLRAAYPGRPLALVLPPAEPPPPCGHGDRGACARALGLPPARRRVLFFGYVRAYKGLPTLIEAMAALPPDVQLVVAGEIYHRDAAFYRALAGRAAERVLLLDRFLATREIACCFAAADVVALPYWTASQSAVAPLAMACGRAVVASDVGGLPDLVRPGETGLLTPPRDAAALAGALARALDHAVPWGAAARRAAGALTWESAAAAVEHLCRDAVSALRAA
jgi:glycosyltransferase involved in cell wall biosynthesis